MTFIIPSITSYNTVETMPRLEAIDGSQILPILSLKKSVIIVTKTNHELFKKNIICRESVEDRKYSYSDRTFHFIFFFKHSNKNVYLLIALKEILDVLIVSSLYFIEIIPSNSIHYYLLSFYVAKF